MFPRIIAGSLRHRAMRVGVAVLSVAMGACLVAALAGISLDVGGKAGRELRSYGANLVLQPTVASGETGLGGLQFGTVHEERYLEQSSLATLDGWSNTELVGYAPYLSVTAEARGRRLSLVGASFERVRSMRPWWSVEGNWAGVEPNSGRLVPGMIGTALARQLGIGIGDVLPVARGSNELAVKIEGIVETGAAEDRQLFAPLDAVQRIAGRNGLVDSVEISAVQHHRPLRDIATEMEQRIPAVRVRVIGQIADAEASALEKVRSLIGLVTALVLVASGLAVASTMAASVMERTREIGLMKALGAGERRVAVVFLTEAVLIALLGAIPGYLLGLGLTQAIGQAVFGSGIQPNALTVPFTLMVALATCLLASILPIRRALQVDPAVTLRGE